MRYVRRIIGWLVVAAGVNLVWWVGGVPLPLPVRILLGLASLAGCLFVGLRPRRPDPPPVPRRTTTMRAGYELLLAAGAGAVANLVWWIWLGLHLADLPGPGPTPAGWALFIADLVVGVVLLAGLTVAGFVRVCLGSRQVTLTRKLLVLLLWWFPPATVLLLGGVMRTLAQESRTQSRRLVRDQARLEDQVCRTRYPVVLVHGIFFRDWDLLNYWGRIPGVLTANGASLHYGGQQSASSVAEAGAELAATVRRIVERTGCGKVNIIAHSKGGLDARWAISRLGLADQVASLTTINTPHRGCNFARQLMEIIPQQAVDAIGSSYDRLFSKLGDPSPDFLAGVVDLTDTECARLNALMPDAPGVLYRSVGSRMASRFAAPFPLNLGYSLVQPLEGDNDGLVAVGSMPWGDFLGLVEPQGKQGISHADMIDLLRRDVGGFDVCEFYVGLVSGLRERGL